MGHELSRGRRALRLAVDHLSFGSPRAIVVNFVAILGILSAWPTQRLGYLPVRSVWVTVFHVRPYSTGMMRALSMFLHGDWRSAWEMNPLFAPALAVILTLVGVNAHRWRRARRQVDVPAS